MTSLQDNLSFEHYIRLKKSYTYHITLLCRYEKEGQKYTLLDIINARRGLRRRITNVIMRQIRFTKNYKKSLLGLFLLLFLIVIYFCKHILLILGLVAFVVMIWYLFVLMTLIDFKNHEIIEFEFVNENNKVQGETCFRSLTKYSDESKVDFLISLTGKKLISRVENLDSYTEILSLIKEYTETNCPLMKTVMAFDTFEETKLIKMI